MYVIFSFFFQAHENETERKEEDMQVKTMTEIYKTAYATEIYFHVERTVHSSISY